jgi:ribosomal protein S17E
LKHQINQSERTFLVPQKCKGAKNSYGGYPTEFAGSTQNFKNIIETSNQPIKTKIFSKKVCLVSQKCKRVKNSYGGYPTEFAGSTQNSKKIVGTSNQPIKTKIFPKQSMFSILKV